MGSSLLFADKANVIYQMLKSETKEEIQARFKISDKLANAVYNDYQNYELNSQALYTYTGEAFKTLDPSSFDKATLNYARDHLLIFSALYGLLRPFDLISLYRLDFMTPLPFSLKNYWSEAITLHLKSLKQPLLNLSSKEFSSNVSLRMIDVSFISVTRSGEEKSISAYAKQARGAMTREVLTKQIKDIESLKTLNIVGFIYDHTHDNTLVFKRKEIV